MHSDPGESAAMRLFRLNRSIPTAARYGEIEQLEQPWISGLLAEVTAGTTPVASRAEWIQRLDALLESERGGSESSHYLADRASYEEFRSYVQAFAVDGLTEAQNFFPSIARLPIKAQMAVMRVLIDEFGCGNLQQAHSYLYLALLDELDLPTDLDTLVAGTSDETFGFLNVFFWLTQRAPDVEYFLGGLAYLEASIPSAFSFLSAGCDRLGIAKGAYYSEHVHIDSFHMKEMQTAIREYEAARGLDPTKVWVGALLLSRLIGEAADAAVERARAVRDAAVG